jgi:MoaA/NifB/PqqE/SkfB family radical SAM enzyme
VRSNFPLFSAVSIQTNSLCNLKCRFCFYGQYENYQSDIRMETEVVHKVIDELKSLEFKGRVSLYNMNEPLTDKRIMDFLSYGRKQLPDCFHFFSTNGRLLTQSLLDQIVSLVDSVRINNYKKLRSLNYEHPKIDLRDKADFINQADSNRGGNLSGLQAANKTGQGPCANPFGHLVIMPPGIVVLCCSDGLKQMQLGDIRAKSIEEIWFGEGFYKIRYALANGKRNAIPLCRNCTVEGGGFYDYFNNPEAYEDLIAVFRNCTPSRIGSGKRPIRRTMPACAFGSGRKRPCLFWSSYMPGWKRTCLTHCLRVLSAWPSAMRCGIGKNSWFTLPTGGWKLITI